MITDVSHMGTLEALIGPSSRRDEWKLFNPFGQVFSHHPIMKHATAQTIRWMGLDSFFFLFDETIAEFLLKRDDKVNKGKAPSRGHCYLLSTRPRRKKSGSKM